MVDVRPSDPLVGAILGGRYRLLDVIGHGGTGRVYRAMQEPIGREVAVKVLHPDLDPEGTHDFQARFLREAALAGRVQHPHVVTVHDYGSVDDGACYIVMEHLRGRTLRSLLRDGPLPVGRALRIFGQLVQGLRAAHNAGLVHRDVKPSNIILLTADDGGDFVKLFDFGLVKGEDESEITHSGMFMGTPQYVSPEQARGGVADGRSDLYSAGVILYRMVCGQLPYTADTPIAVAVKHAREPLPPMRSRAPDVAVPAAVEAFVRRLLEKDADDRFDDAEAVLDALVALTGELAIDDFSVEPTLRVGAGDAAAAPLARLRADEPELTVDDTPDRGRWRASLGLGALLLAGAGGLVLFSRAQAPADDLAQLAVVAGDLQAEEPPPVEPSPPQPPPPAEVVILISSTPSGAEVWLDDALLGLTPLARRITVPSQVPSEEPAATTTFRLVLDGYRDGDLTLSLDQGEAAGHVDLVSLAPQRRPVSRTTAAPASAGSSAASSAASKAARTAAGTDVIVDDVRFTPAQAAATLALINDADGDTLRASGVAPRQANILLDHRPFSDLAEVAATPFIGPKTMEALRGAADR